jgi:molybdopterin molybdotransferase
VISVEEALSRCLALSPPLPSEDIPLAKAAGRWLSVPVTALRDQPPFPASAMDGYAVAGDPVEGDSFRVIGEAGAGHAFAGTLGPGEALRIFTGAPVPDGAIRVLIQEDVTRTNDSITLKGGADAATHIRPHGQDFLAGTPLGPRLLRPNDLALLAAMGIARPTVTRRPDVAIIATGDEIVLPGEAAGPEQIYASNVFALKAMIEAEGGAVRVLPIARDRTEALQTVLGLADGADMILTIGGASVGEHDLVGRVAEGMGLQRAFWQIAMRPGKPLMAGRLGAATMVGLPGNPVSAIVCGHLFVLPMIRAMLGRPDAAPTSRRAVLGCDLPGNGPRDHYMRARLEQSDAMPRITPMARQDSSLLSVLTEADALLIRPREAAPAQAGDIVNYLPL